MKVSDLITKLSALPADAECFINCLEQLEVELNDGNIAIEVQFKEEEDRNEANRECNT